MDDNNLSFLTLNLITEFNFIKYCTKVVLSHIFVRLLQILCFYHGTKNRKLAF